MIKLAIKELFKKRTLFFSFLALTICFIYVLNFVSIFSLSLRNNGLCLLIGEKEYDVNVTTNDYDKIEECGYFLTNINGGDDFNINGITGYYKIVNKTVALEYGITETSFLYLPKEYENTISTEDKISVTINNEVFETNITGFTDEKYVVMSKEYLKYSNQGFVTISINKLNVNQIIEYFDDDLKMVSNEYSLKNLFLFHKTISIILNFIIICSSVAFVFIIGNYISVILKIEKRNNAIKKAIGLDNFSFFKIYNYMFLIMILISQIVVLLFNGVSVNIMKRIMSMYPGFVCENSYFSSFILLVVLIFSELFFMILNRKKFFYLRIDENLKEMD